MHALINTTSLDLIFYLIVIIDMSNNEGLTVLSCLVLKVHGCIATIINKSADCDLVVVNSGMDQQ